MCGIVGYVGKKKVVPVIIEGLRRLEYRGYDSAGIAVGSPARAALPGRAEILWAYETTKGSVYVGPQGYVLRL